MRPREEVLRDALPPAPSTEMFLFSGTKSETRLFAWEKKTKGNRSLQQAHRPGLRRERAKSALGPVPLTVGTLGTEMKKRHKALSYAIRTEVRW